MEAVMEAVCRSPWLCGDPEVPCTPELCPFTPAQEDVRTFPGWSYDTSLGCVRDNVAPAPPPAQNGAQEAARAPLSGHQDSTDSPKEAIMSDTTPEPGTSTAVELLGRLVEGQQEIIRLLQAQQLDRQQQRQEPRQQKPKPAPAKQAGERYRQPSEGDGSLPSIQGWKPSKDGKRLTRVLQRGEHTGRRAVIGQGRKADYSLSIAPADDGGDWWNIGYYATPQRAANVIAKMELGAEEPF